MRRMSATATRGWTSSLYASGNALPYKPRQPAAGLVAQSARSASTRSSSHVRVASTSLALQRGLVHLGDRRALGTRTTKCRRASTDSDTRVV